MDRQARRAVDPIGISRVRSSKSSGAQLTANLELSLSNGIRLPLQTFFYWPESVKLGDLMRLLVQHAIEINLRMHFSRDDRSGPRSAKVRSFAGLLPRVAFQQYSAGISCSGHGAQRANRVQSVKQNRKLCVGLRQPSCRRHMLPKLYSWSCAVILNCFPLARGGMRRRPVIGQRLTNSTN